MSRHVLLAALAAGVAGVAATDTRAAVVYSTAGSTYSQSFDSLPNTPLNTSLGNTPTGWTDDNTSPAAGNFSIEGWYLFHPTVQAEGGFNGNQRMRIGAGTVNTGAFMSYGPASGTTTDRAMSCLNSNTLAPAATGMAFLGFRVNNNTGLTLTEFTLEFDGEQWRDGGSNGGTPAAQSIVFEYKLAAASIQDTGYTGASALNFTSPVFTNTGAGAAVDGNTAGGSGGRVDNITATVTGLSWAPGTDLWLRWVDTNETGNDHGLGVDDVNFSAVPESVSLSLVALGGLSLGRRRRRMA